MTPRRSLIPLIAAALLAACGGARAQTILMVTNNNSLSSEESLRRTQFENWGYTVTTVRDSHSQATYDTAMASADVVYVSEEVSANSVAYKLREATIGVISEERFLDAEFGFATSDGYEDSGDTISVTDNTHEVSTDLSTGFVQIFSSSQPRIATQGTLAGGFQELASTFGGDLTLGVIETGGALANAYNGNSTASGRRVRLPWGGGSFSFSSLNSDGLSILENALAWASGGGGGSSLVGHWKLDETSGTTAADSSSYGNDGTYENGVLLGTEGPRGAAADFDGADDGVWIGDYDAHDVTDSLSVAAWIKLNALPGTVQYVLAKGTSQSYRFRINAGGFASLDLFGTSGQETAAVTVMPVGRWVHVVGTYDGTTTKIYLDGVLDHQEASTGSINVTNNNLTIGKSYLDTLHLEGLIDDVRIYDYALTEPEIAEIYGLVGHWKLDEASGSTAADSSLNANDGTHESGVTEGQAGPLSGTLAAEYDGSNNQTEITHGGDWNAVDDCFSLTTWVRIDTTSDSHGLIVWSDTASPYALLVNNDDELELRANWGSVTGESGNITHSSTGTLSSGVWTHVAATYDGSTVRLYLDGVEDPNTLSTSATIGTSTDEMQLGGDDGSNYDLTGALHDARVYNRRLLPEEIADLAGSSTSTGVRITSWVEIANP